MKRTPAVAAALILCFTASSYAEFVVASSVTDIRFHVNNGGDLANAIGLPNGTVMTETTSSTPNGAHILDVIVGFTYSSGGAKAPGVTIYGISSTGSVTLDSMAWSTDATEGNGNDSATVSVGLTLAAGPVNIFVTGPANSFVSNFAGANYTFVYLHFTPTDGSNLSIDAFSNPEPGTLALFALGAAGLGGFAIKRRRARLAARRPA